MFLSVDRIVHNLKNRNLSVYEFVNKDLVSNKKGDNPIRKKYGKEWKSIKNIFSNDQTFLVGYEKENGDINNKSISVYGKDNKEKFNDFEQFRNYFVDENNGHGYSKKLGVQKTDRNKDDLGDKYVNNILAYLNNDDIIQNDDEGILLTQRLLGNNPTHGIDLDLLNTDSADVFEFLRRVTDKVTNESAHPMRYCWTKYHSDNRQKFISLWNVTNQINGNLFLVSYSCDENGQYNDENIKIIHVKQIDPESGFREDVEYKLTYEEFLKTLSISGKNESNFLKELQHNNFPKFEMTEDDFNGKWWKKEDRNFGIQ